MPIYEYQCCRCKEIQEVWSPVADRPPTLPCECGHPMHQILSDTNVHGQEPAWINQQLRSHLQDESEKPIETRKDLNEWAKKNDFVPRN
jgi:putative FmdB family regulatory protein